MAIFNSYVKLPEGIMYNLEKLHLPMASRRPICLRVWAVTVQDLPAPISLGIAGGVSIRKHVDSLDLCSVYQYELSCSHKSYIIKQL